LVERDGVQYEGIPSVIPERFNRKTFYYQKSLIARRALRSFRPDLVHAFGFETGAATIALRSGYPVSCFIQGIAEDYFPYYKQRDWIDRNVGRWAEQRAAQRVRWMVAENEYAKKWALSQNPEARVAIIPHPTREDFFLKAAPTYSNSVLSVGNLDERKGMDTVIRAFAMVRIPGDRLVVAGGGPLRDELARLAKDLGVCGNIEFTGALDTSGVIARMNSARALVIGSRMDTSPNVLSEAHAIGLPVIATRTGGIPEMIDDGVDGFLVEVNDAPAMGRRIGELLADLELARSLGEAGRRKVRDLNSAARVAEAHRQFFEQIRQELGIQR
jgi:glycosyltransferase involved in cell wall biosynthesis